MTDLRRLSRQDIGAIADLCRRAVFEAPNVEELDASLFSEDEPTVVRGDPEVGVVVTVESDSGAHVRLLAVDPAARGQGHGHALVRAAEDDAIALGYGQLTIGADPSYFLWPGVPARETALLCLLERHHYSRVETNFDMSVDLHRLPEDPGGHLLAGPETRDELDTWMATHWPNWRLEVLRALDKGNLVISRADQSSERSDITAFCAFEVNRKGFLGPVAVRPDLLGRGMGRAALIGALHELQRRGRKAVDVAWVGPVVPYASVGGVVTTVYFVYRRDLR